jgi:Fe-S cluster assembly protein SufD
MTKTLDVQTAAQPYLAAFETFAGNGARQAPAWLTARRESAIARFAEVGFPDTRQEEWRFTDVKSLATTDFTLAAAVDPDLLSAEEVRSQLLSSSQFTAVFVNGLFADSLSSLEGLPPGVTVGSLRTALAKHPELVERYLGQCAKDEENPFTALNTAFVDDGAFVYVPQDTSLEQPIQILLLAVPQDGTPLVWHPRNLIIADRGARAAIVETYLGLAEGTYWVNAVTEVAVGENANLDTYRVQQDEERGFHTATTHSSQARNSNYSCATFAFGASLTRHDINAVLDGDGADCTLDGLSILRGRQHVDFHTTLEHAKPHCTSWEYFNGVFDDRARGIFNGRIIVRPGAQRTDSKQTNNNLLLSKHARADSQPQLEIYADDVRCTHGATLGPIDEKQLYYLQTRGLHAEAARSLLTYGFCAEILKAVKLVELRERLDSLVRRRLEEAPGDR